MPQRSLFAAPLALLLAIAAAAQTTPSASAPIAGEPRITLSQDSWNFGRVRHLDKLEQTITISNTGTGELRILKVHTNCGCTAARPEKFNLGPGESTSLGVSFNTRGKQGKTTSDVTIESNDKSTPKKIFHLEGEVTRVIRMEPDSVVFRALSTDEVMSSSVRIVNTSPQPMQLDLGRIASDKFTAELREVVPGREYALTITTKPPFPDRAVSDNLGITTRLDDEPRLDLPLQIVQTDRVNFLQPAMLVSGNRRQPLQTQVEIEYFGNDPAFRVTKAECDEPHVVLHVGEPSPAEPDRPGRKPASVSLLTVDYPPQTVFPPGGLVIRVFTNDPEYPELKTYATPDMAIYRDLSLRGRTQSQRKVP